MSDTCKIFVGGLAWACTSASLSSHFSSYGPISEAIIMTDKATGNSRGFGFVTFESSDSVVKCCRDRHMLNDKYADVKPAVERGSAPPPAHGAHGGAHGGAQQTQSQSNESACKIFIGGLPSSCSKEDLFAYFSNFGPVLSSHVSMDSVTGNSRGFGFVTFDSEATQRAAIAVRVHAIKGKQVEVRQDGGPGGGMQGSGTGGTNGNGNSPRKSNANSDVCPPGENPAYFYLARRFGRTGWRAGYGTHAFGPHGFAVPGWEGSDAYNFPGMFGFSFSDVNGGIVSFENGGNKKRDAIGASIGAATGAATGADVDDAANDGNVNKRQKR
jgi:RNA-binding protein Musashi